VTSLKSEHEVDGTAATVEQKYIAVNSKHKRSPNSEKKSKIKSVNKIFVKTNSSSAPKKETAKKRQKKVKKSEEKKNKKKNQAKKTNHQKLKPDTKGSPKQEGKQRNDKTA